ncbi:MAG: ABC transporter substrate-binding protein [Aeromicrobium sp.]
MSPLTTRPRAWRRKAAVSAALVLAASAVLSACGGGGSGSSSSSSDTLTIGLNVKPQSLNPGKNGNGGQNIVQWLAYEPLIRSNSDGTYSPGLATKWGYVGEGNTAFEMTIRTDAQFADGTPVTAKSVADSLTYYLENPGPLSHYLTGVTSATVKDDSTVAIALDKPNPILPDVFSQTANWGDVISPAGLAAPDKLTSEMFGAGAYTMDTAQTVDGDHYTFVKNPKYWNAKTVTYKKVVVKVLPDANSALQALRSGQIQVDMNATGPLADQAKSAGATVVEGPGFVQAMYLMDRDGVTLKAFGDPEVRKALNYAVDRKAIAKALGGAYEPTAQIAPRGSDAYDKTIDDLYPYDPAKAKQMLADAGYADGLELSMLSLSILDTDTVAQAVADQLAKVGVKVTIKSDGADINQYIADMATKKYPAVIFNAGTDMFPNALQNFASAASPLNPFASTGTEVTGAFDTLAAASESDREAAAVALNKAVAEQAWFVPVAGTSTFIYTKGIDDVGAIGSSGGLDVLSWKPAS